MPIVNRVADLHREITDWRRDLHAHPELLFDVHRTAGSVAEKLKAFGCDEVVTGLGRTGVVGVIHGRKGFPGKTIGLRADMDALPIEEAMMFHTNRQSPGKCMHAVMTAIRPCCSAQRDISPKPAILLAPRW